MSPTASVRKCNGPHCGLGKHIIEGDVLEIKEKTFTVKEDMDCKVSNCLYVLF